jgi:hypothetical protein
MISAGLLVDLSDKADRLGLGGNRVVYQGHYLPDGAHLWLRDPLPGVPPAVPLGRLAEMRAAEPALQGLAPYRVCTGAFLSGLRA